MKKRYFLLISFVAVALFFIISSVFGANPPEFPGIKTGSTTEGATEVVLKYAESLGNVRIEKADPLSGSTILFVVRVIKPEGDEYHYITATNYLKWRIIDDRTEL